jgi:hypothetical protein
LERGIHSPAALSRARNRICSRLHLAGTMQLTAPDSEALAGFCGLERGIYAASTSNHFVISKNASRVAIATLKRHECRAPVFTQMNRSGRRPRGDLCSTVKVRFRVVRVSSWSSRFNDLTVQRLNGLWLVPRIGDSIFGISYLHTSCVRDTVGASISCNRYLRREAGGSTPQPPPRSKRRGLATGLIFDS